MLGQDPRKGTTVLWRRGRPLLLLADWVKEIEIETENEIENAQIESVFLGVLVLER